jgi:hypothetical protein
MWRVTLTCLFAIFAGCGSVNQTSVETEPDAALVYSTYTHDDARLACSELTDRDFNWFWDIVVLARADGIPEDASAQKLYDSCETSWLSFFPTAHDCQNCWLAIVGAVYH